MDRKTEPTAGERIVQAYTNGEAIRAWEFMGAHAQERDGQQGYVFRVWAPHAQAVSVVGDFNRWDEEADPTVIPLRLFDVDGKLKIAYVTPEWGGEERVYGLFEVSRFEVDDTAQGSP